MTDAQSKALVPQGPTALSPVSRLAERTLAERAEREALARTGPQTHVVGPGGYQTIGEAVAAAGDGDTILVRPGRYKESVVVARKSLTITGDGERDEIVVGTDTGPAFALLNTITTLAGLTVVEGGTVDGERFSATVLISGGDTILERLHVSGFGIVIVGGAHGAVSACEIAGKYVGISIDGADSDPTVSGNRIHDGQGLGIVIFDGASPRIEDNEVWANADSGIWIEGADSDPTVSGNRIHDNQGDGIYVDDGASPRIEDNEVWANAFVGIWIEGADSDPTVSGNRIHGNQSIGINVEDGASPRIEDNEVWANVSSGIVIGGAGTDPAVSGNRVHDNRGDGIAAYAGAGPTITGNTITGNTGRAVAVYGNSPAIVSENVT